ncbi:extracellular solute-binding protein [Pseudomaricurvus alkylphenolicus]|uniref:extracellular solute-binding protein n=1 Tax=Pseudomaricurvus alkylphenolicus TaxID=1306991 RepID=UPI001F10BFD2|nr:extracellular solute-binding protein [Pseudomaricurvus alkylphenolicus]
MLFLRSFRLACLGSLLLAGLWTVTSQLALAESTIIKTHAIAMHGDPKYGSDFKHFEYVEPSAPKGGTLRLHSIGTYDSLNPYIAKGTPATGLGLIYDTLMTSSADEPFTEYGLLATKVEYPEDRSWVIFHLNPEARFHDGMPVTAEDAAFTFDLLIKEGRPLYAFYYADITSAEALDKHRVKFNFKSNASRETLLITGQLPVLPKHYWKDRKFSESSLEIPVGSGPYKIARIDAGRSIVYERVKDYWGGDHPVQKGHYNFDKMVYDYYRDDVVALEAFKADEYDFRRERISKLWASAYDGDALQSGRIQKEQIPHQNPTGMQCYLFNLRKPIFQDETLRRAIVLAFDFEWANKNLFHNAYTRTESYFSNSELASSGLPSAAELKLLEPHRDKLPPELFTKAFKAPRSTGDDRNRKNLRAAKKLLEQAGYKLGGGQLKSPQGQDIKFDILMTDASSERILNPFIQSLKKLGIMVKLRRVDPSQFIERRRNFDYDMISHVYSQSLSPGNEQRDFWHSASVDSIGSRNLVGISDPVVDDLVAKVIEAHSREELVVATRALDRVLLNRHFVIPAWHISSHRIAYWNRYERPAISPIYDLVYQTGLMTWWAKDAQ